MKKKIKVICIIILSIIIIIAGGFLIYTSDYYKADEFAIQTMKSAEIAITGNLTTLLSSPSDCGLIFYPGGKVEETAYLPLLEKLRQNGITCILVKMPAHIAVLNPNAADDIFEQYPDIKKWYIAGHSLGGAMASSYASEHQDKVEGVILLGAYIYGDIPEERTATIYGTEDMVLDKSKIDYTKNVFVIDGANHAQFGNYGIQKGDGSASITADEQQKKTVEIIMDFID